MTATQMICPRLITALTGIDERELLTLQERPGFPMAMQGTPKHPLFDLAQIERWFASMDREFRSPNAFERVVMAMEATRWSLTRRDFARLVRGLLHMRRIVGHHPDTGEIWDEHRHSLAIAPDGDPLVELFETVGRSHSGMRPPFGPCDELGVPFYWTMGTLSAADAARLMDAVASVPADQIQSVSRRINPGPERPPVYRHSQGRDVA
jgi:hypothetical protein